MDHLLGVRGEHEVDLVSALTEMMKESLEIDRSAGSGGGEDEAHGKRL
jgi:hypothetical protein